MGMLRAAAWARMLGGRGDADCSPATRAGREGGLQGALTPGRGARWPETRKALPPRDARALGLARSVRNVNNALKLVADAL